MAKVQEFLGENLISGSSVISSSGSTNNVTGVTLLGNGSTATVGTGDSSQFSGAQTIGSNTRSVTRAGSGLVLDSVRLNAVMRALNQGNLAEQESSPTLITEDNEQGIISIIDRIPIIVATVNQTSAGSNSHPGIVR